MMNETRYRRCDCGADMAIEVVTEGKKLVKVVFTNAIPIGPTLPSFFIATFDPMKPTYGKINNVRCCICGKRRGVSIFKV